MTLLAVLVLLVLFAVWLVAGVVRSPEWQRSQALTERELHQARRSREAMELRHEIRAEMRRARRELEVELRDVPTASRPNPNTKRSAGTTPVSSPDAANRRDVTP